MQVSLSLKQTHSHPFSLPHTQCMHSVSHMQVSQSLSLSLSNTHIHTHTHTHQQLPFVHDQDTLITLPTSPLCIMAICDWDQSTKRQIKLNNSLKSSNSWNSSNSFNSWNSSNSFNSWNSWNSKHSYNSWNSYDSSEQFYVFFPHHDISLSINPHPHPPPLPGYL